MAKIIAVKTRFFGDSNPRPVFVVEVEKASFIPAGWIAPSKAYALGDWSMKNPIKHPSRRVVDCVSIPSAVVHSVDCRIIPDEIQERLESIDAQVKALRIERQSLLDNEFMTFPLVQSSDLKLDEYHTKNRYASKSEANKHGK